MVEPTPLNLWTTTRPTPEQREILQQAKLRSGVPEDYKPVRATPGCGRVLSFEGRPPFYCSWAETSWDDPKLDRKIAWALTGVGGRPYTEQDWVQALIPGAKEVTHEDSRDGVA
jgi:hypothetical protein